MKVKEVQNLFIKATGILQDNATNHITNIHGVIVEKGIGDELNSITYHLDEDVIKVYINGSEILSFDSNNPILMLFKELIEGEATKQLEGIKDILSQYQDSLYLDNIRIKDEVTGDYREGTDKDFIEFLGEEWTGTTEELKDLGLEI